MRYSLASVTGCAVWLLGTGLALAQDTKPPITPNVLTLSVRKIERNVVDEHNSGMAGIKYGAEGGEVMRDPAGLYHWFTSEQYADLYWVANRIAHWTSPDGRSWSRDVRWTKVGNQDQTCRLDKSNYFDPTVVYDEQTGYWYMFYVGYRYCPETPYQFGKIYRAKALNPGPAGLGGPYHDNDADDVLVMQQLESPPPYEREWVGTTRGGLGANSVTIYHAGKLWYMLWAENQLATATSLAGSFTRLPEGPVNPVTYGRPRMYYDPKRPGDFVYDSFWIENPVVTRIPPGRPGAGTLVMLVGFYADATIGVTTPTTCGWATSRDGQTWSEVRPIFFGLGDCITALGLLPEANGHYSMFITNRESGMNSFERMSRIEIAIDAVKQGRNAGTRGPQQPQ